MNFAVMSNNTVINLIVADSKEIAEEATKKICIEYTTDNPAHVGLSYDGTTFEQPVALVVEEPTND